MTNATKPEKDFSVVYKRWTAGEEYDKTIALHETVNENERMYAGDQWRGVQANGLPTPVFNIIKRMTDFFIASIMSQPVKITYVPELIGDEGEDVNEKEALELVKLVNGHTSNIWEKCKLDMLTREALYDAAIAGDGYIYAYFDADYETGQEIKGRIKAELIDSVNVVFGNANNRNKEEQPYIIIRMRKLLKDVRDEAVKYGGIKEGQEMLIRGDSDTEGTAGDRGQIENQSDDSKKVNVYLMLERDKETGRIFATKAIKNMTIRPKWDTTLTKYPIARTSWGKRKNSYRGTAFITGLSPNQRYINKLFAMVMLHTMRIAFPKVVYDRNRIAAWSNKVGAAIGVRGDINNAAKILNGAEMSQSVMNTIEYAINYTKEMCGASDAALGDVKPENTSAIVMVTKQAAIPLETVKEYLYQMVEDLGEIFIDMMGSHYGKRTIVIDGQDGRVKNVADFGQLKGLQLMTRVEVGPSTYYSEVAANQTLDNLLNLEKITFLQYLERVTNGLIPEKDKLIEQLKQGDYDEIILMESMARYYETLPPEAKEQLSKLPEEEMETEIKRLMVQNMK